MCAKATPCQGVELTAIAIHSAWQSGTRARQLRSPQLSAVYQSSTLYFTPHIAARARARTTPGSRVWLHQLCTTECNHALERTLLSLLEHSSMGLLSSILFACASRVCPVVFEAGAGSEGGLAPTTLAPSDCAACHRGLKNRGKACSRARCKQPIAFPSGNRSCQLPGPWIAKHCNWQCYHLNHPPYRQHLMVALWQPGDSINLQNLHWTEQRKEQQNRAHGIARVIGKCRLH